jgi:hypothetical protein
LLIFIASGQLSFSKIIFSSIISKVFLFNMCLDTMFKELLEKKQFC